MKQDIRIVTADEAPLKVKPVITNPGWAGKNDLTKVPMEQLYAMLVALYDINDFEVLMVWKHFFLGVDIRTIEKEHGFTITRQRTLYAKYKEKVKKHQKSFKGGIYDDVCKT